MTRSRSALLLLPGLVALAAEPLVWLVKTWLDPSYDNPGAVAAVLALALTVRSVGSGPAAAAAPRTAALLLVASALVRLSGRLLAVHHLGALALVLDAWAVGLALGLRWRPWPVQPAALAGLAALALPAEQLLQRLGGQPLREVSAVLAGAVLSPFVGDLVREGTLLSRAGLRVSVDLPCSGAQGLVLLGGLALVLLTRRALAWPLALGLAVVGAVVANTTRIAALVVVPGWIHEPAHTALGLFALELGALPLVLLARGAEALRPWPGPGESPLPVPPPVAVGFSLVAVLVAFAPHRPVDVSGVVEGASLPSRLGARHGVSLPLSEQEREYFERFGGVVQKLRYDGGEGGLTAMLVRTTAPVRHLHDPTLCMAGAGYTVEPLGVQPGALPAALYRATDAQGQSWRVQASFYSTRGHRATSGSEVAWAWLRAPRGTWALLERVTPWTLCEQDPRLCVDFERALTAALDL